MRDDFRQPDEVKPRFEPWPWAVGLALLAFVVVDLSMVTLASRTFEGPDQAGYYKMGLEHDRRVALRREGWTVVSNLPASLRAGERLTLSATVLDAQGRPVQGEVQAHIGRPATRTQDTRLALPGEWIPQRGYWDVTYTFGGQPLDEVRVYAQ